LVLVKGEIMINTKIFSSIFNIAAPIVVFACLFHALRADAAVVSPGASVTITRSLSYTTFGGGDFVFSTSVGAPGCESGWYIKATDPGYKTTVAAVFTAQAGGNFVLVWGDNADIWNGSPSGHFCRLQVIGITS
jgi:hypothetical protein